MSYRNFFSILAAVCLISFLGACAPNPQPTGLTPVPSLAPAATLTLVSSIQNGSEVNESENSGGPGVSSAGAAVFMLHCTACHGINGEGANLNPDTQGPALRNNTFIQTHDIQTIQNTISNGRPGKIMPAWQIAQGGPLTSTEIKDAAAYLLTLQNVSVIPSPTPVPEGPTDTPAPADAPTEAPAAPSNAGDTGPAVQLVGDAQRGISLFGANCAKCHGPQGVMGAPNPGSDDGSVPVLNPIDPTLTNTDPKIFAQNVDLFIEHGSVPSGPGPMIMMPYFGDNKLLTPQQIADLIAYLFSLNPGN
jgi:mono/diheme cytochrome c family protein